MIHPIHLALCLMISTTLSTGLSGEVPHSESKVCAENVQKVMDFLDSISGKYVLSGQQEAPGQLLNTQAEVLQITGKRPAIRGWDIRDENPCPVEEASESWDRYQQLITFSWHMGKPPLPDSYENSKAPASLQELERMLTPGDPLHEAFLRKLDGVASKLLRLQERGIPVLWRPFHEAEGDLGSSWFWWSDGGPAYFKRLWVFMFEYFTDVKGLQNLIWVYSANRDPLESCEGEGSEWYPGERYCDILGTDVYTSFEHPANIANWSRYFANLQQLAPGKRIALTENDVIPSPDLLSSDFPMLWFLTWHSEWLRENPDDFLRWVYHHSRTITADEMPELR